MAKIYFVLALLRSHKLNEKSLEKYVNQLISIAQQSQELSGIVKSAIAALMEEFKSQEKLPASAEKIAAKMIPKSVDQFTLQDYELAAALRKSISSEEHTRNLVKHLCKVCCKFL